MLLPTDILNGTSHVRCSPCTRCARCSFGSTFAFDVVVASISLATWSAFRVLQSSGHRRHNACDWASSWSLDIRHRNLSLDGGPLACSQHSTRWCWNLFAAWFIASSGLGCAAATPDGVVSLVWSPASATLVGGEAPTSCELATLTSTSCGGGSTTPRGASAGPPCARRAGSTSHAQELLDLVS